jgi:hypothetical protein
MGAGGREIRKESPDGDKMPTKRQLWDKETNRCKHVNEAGEQVCKLNGIYIKCYEDGTAAEPTANKRCSAHQLVGQVHRSNTRGKFIKKNPGKGAQPKKKKILKRKRPSNSQKSSSSASTSSSRSSNSQKSSSSASTSSSRSWSSNDSYSTSDSNYSSRVAGNHLYFVSGTQFDLIFAILPF